MSNDNLERLISNRPKVKPRSDKLSSDASSNTEANESSYIDAKAHNHTVVRNSILLEEAAQNLLTQICDQEKLIKAVWIEAAVVCLQNHPEVMEEVFEEARSRLAIRKEAARIRQAKTFSQKLSS